MLKRLLLSSIAMLAVLTIGASQKSVADSSDAGGVILEVQASKASYTLGEPIQLRLSLRNRTKHKVLVAKTFQLAYYIDLDITGPDGQRSKWCGRIVDQTDTSRSFTVLAPGAAVSRSLTISCVHGNDPGEAWGYDVATPGEHTIVATYHLPQPSEFFKKISPTVAIVRGPITASKLRIHLISKESTKR